MHVFTSPSKELLCCWFKKPWRVTSFDSRCVLHNNQIVSAAKHPNQAGPSGSFLRVPPKYYLTAMKINHTHHTWPHNCQCVVWQFLLINFRAFVSASRDRFEKHHLNHLWSSPVKYIPIILFCQGVITWQWIRKASPINLWSTWYVIVNRCIHEQSHRIFLLHFHFQTMWMSAMSSTMIKRGQH